MKELSYEQAQLLRKQEQLNDLRTKASVVEATIAQFDARLKPLRARATHLAESGRMSSREYVEAATSIKKVRAERRPHCLALSQIQREIGALKGQIEPQKLAFMMLEQSCPDEAEHTLLLRRLLRTCQGWVRQGDVRPTPQQASLLESVEVALGKRSFLNEHAVAPRSASRPTPTDPKQRTQQVLQVLEQVAKSKAVGLK